MYAAPASANQTIYPRLLNEGYRLKIGYVSPDFRTHSVSYFIEPVIRTHNREEFEVYCYSNVEKEDEVTKRFRKIEGKWRNIWGMDDSQVIGLIKRDKIDILIDLAGHSNGNRLLVFARRPAKVQVTWLGYPNTTGLKTMDYRLTDAVADPPGKADTLHSEKLIRMEKGFLCYQPETSAPEVAPLPSAQRGYITFGSFNNLSKITFEVVRVWADILKSVPNSRLLLKSSTFANHESKMRFIKMFEETSVTADRLKILGWLPSKEAHLNLYREIDIGLDTFPYNGTTTTCEALWMGVPVITLRGNRHSGRVGASLMHHTGLEELIAESKEEYKSLSTSLAQDIFKLKKIRSSLRDRVRQSPLVNEQQFTEILENIYKKIFKQG